MERLLVAKPGTPETKTNDYRLFSLGHKPRFPNKEIFHCGKHLCNQPKLSPLSLQAKLEVSQPRDEYEQEADRVADMVMRMPEPKVQRQAGEEKEEEDQTLQTKELPGQVPVTHKRDVPPIVHEVLRSPGQPLDAGTRALMEQRFGHDFSKVRVHTDEKAAEAARAINASAFTVGRHVTFGVGRYAPRTNEGQRLLAHELVHTVQQGKISKKCDLDFDKPHITLFPVKPDKSIQLYTDLTLPGQMTGEETWLVGLAPSPKTTLAKPSMTEERNYICGPDITLSLLNTLNEVQNTFQKWNLAQKAEACSTIISPLKYSMAWDIEDLYEPSWMGNRLYYPNCGVPGATKEGLFRGGRRGGTEDPATCSNSVQVGNQCFLAGTVNYALFGSICRLCFNTFGLYHENTMKKLIFAWTLTKHLSGEFDDLLPPTAWAVGAYQHLPGFAIPQGNRSKCAVNKCRIPCRRQFKWIWEPHQKR